MFIKPTRTRRKRDIVRFLEALRASNPLIFLGAFIAMLCAPPMAPLLLAMAQGDILIDSDGNIKQDAAGNVRLDDGTGDCCCFECANCSAIPSAISITISGWAPNTTCIGPCRAGNNAFYNATAGSDLDGTYDLEPLADCCWFVDVPSGQVTAERYQNGPPSCVTLAGSNPEVRIFFCKNTSTSWVIQAISSDSDGGEDVFVGTQATAADYCGDATYTIANAGPSCLTNLTGGVPDGSASVTVTA